MAGRNQHFQFVKIAAGASLSAVVNLSEFRLCGVKIPAVWTAADLTMQAAADLTGQSLAFDPTNSAAVFGNVMTATGNEYTLTASANAFIAVPILDLAGVQWLKLRSGTAGAPVAQAQDSVVILVYRPTV